jgi:uncharacterized protein (TIRG00374 family)
MPKSLRKISLNVLVLLVIIVALVVFVDLPSVGQALVSIPYQVVLIALLLATCDRVFMGYKWHHLIRSAGEKLALRHAVSAYYQSGIGSRLIPIPFGAEYLRAHLIITKGVPGAVVFGSMAIEKMLAFLGSSILGLIGCIYLFGEFQGETRKLFLFALLIGMAGGSLLLVVFLGRSVHRWGGNISNRYLPLKLARPLSQFSQAVLTFRDNPKVIFYNLLLAFGEQMLQITKFFVIGQALNITLPVFTFLSILSLTIFFRRITAYFEGWGLGEFSAVVILALLGVDRDTSVTLIILNYAITSSASFPGIYLLYRSGFGFKGQVSPGKNTT